ncbi:MAG: hypothetical protein ABFD65_09590 [Candidatus Polarisedimenticolia bacterium]
MNDDDATSRPLPSGESTFDLRLGAARVRLAGLPAPWDAFVAPRYGAFAEQPGAAAPDLVVACAQGPEGTIVPLPPPGGATVLEIERTAPRAFSIRSHWAEGTIDLDAGRGALRLAGRAENHVAMSVENFLRVACQLLAIERGMFLLHGAAVLDGGRAFLFFGPSGAGKSTATAFSAPRPALSDDMALIDVSGAVPVARAVPFHMKFPPELRVRGAYPVAAALRLRQAPEDRLEPLSPGRAVATISASVPFVHELGLPHEGLTALVARFAAATPAADLRFTKSARFWELLGAAFPPAA